MRPSSPQLAVTISLAGELDLVTAPGVRSELIALASVVQAPEIVVDLDKVTFMDSAGLKPLIAAQNLLNRRGKKLALQGVPRSSAHLIRAAGLGTSLNVLDISARDDRPMPTPLLPVQLDRARSTDL